MLEVAFGVIVVVKKKKKRKKCWLKGVPPWHQCLLPIASVASEFFLAARAETHWRRSGSATSGVVVAMVT